MSLIVNELKQIATAFNKQPCIQDDPAPEAAVGWGADERAQEVRLHDHRPADSEAGRRGSKSRLNEHLILRAGGAL